MAKVTGGVLIPSSTETEKLVHNWIAIQTTSLQQKVDSIDKVILFVDTGIYKENSQ